MSFTKDDLQDGDIVVTRDGVYYMYFKHYAGYDDIFSAIFTKDFLSGESFLPDLSNICIECDITKVYRAYNPWTFPRNEKEIKEEYKIVFKETKKKVYMSTCEAIERLSEITDCEVEII